MNIFTMVVSIVAICVIGDVLKRRYDIKKIKRPHPAPHDINRLIANNEQLNHHVQSLENRVVNLERIVTEESYELDDAINKL